MRGTALCLGILAVFTVVTGGAVATANTPPLVTAGVDQTVTPGSTVYLDANGSTDPDGEITSVEWTIETPGGTTQTPNCETCRQTQFTASATGQYTVTLSVTDDDGATRSDTLYVTVESREGPSVSLSAPTTAVENNENTFTANADATNASLESISWLVDGDVVAQQSVSGSDATDSLTHTFDTAESVEVSVVVYDTLGYRGQSSQTVSVASDNSTYTPGSCTGEGAVFCGDSPADPVVDLNGNLQIIDTNSEPGIQAFGPDGEVQTYKNPTSSEYISRQNDALIIENGVSVSDAFADTDTANELNSDNRSQEYINSSNRRNSDNWRDRGGNSGTVSTLAEQTQEVLSSIGVDVSGSEPGDGGSNNNGDSNDNEESDAGSDGGGLVGTLLGGNDDGGDNDGGGSDGNDSGGGGPLGGLI
jgi:hypothetical protein